MGMSSEQCTLIHLASSLHDIGKIGLPDEILIKEEKLNQEELEIFKMHSAIGAEILAGSDSKLLQMAESICKNHQEKWDGSGYPNGLNGQKIPLEARILAVCVELEKLTHQEQKSSISIEAAAKELVKKSGVFFDPEVVKACHSGFTGNQGKRAPIYGHSSGKPTQSVSLHHQLKRLLGILPQESE